MQLQIQTQLKNLQYLSVLYASEIHFSAAFHKTACTHHKVTKPNYVKTLTNKLSKKLKENTLKTLCNCIKRFDIFKYLFWFD